MNDGLLIDAEYSRVLGRIQMEADLDRLQGYGHGTVDYISVPIIPELLRAKVRIFLQLYRKARELETLYREVSRLSTRLITVQDEERRRIARALHDGLGQDLAAAKMTVEKIQAAESKENAAEVAKLIENVTCPPFLVQQVRSISHLLHPPLLDELGLESAIRWYIEEFTKRSGIETSIDVQPVDFPRCVREHENAVYRIVQEALTNVLRHSGARKVKIGLKWTKRQTSVAVRDDGKGIPKYIMEFQPGCIGVGLAGMRQRVKELGGTLLLRDGNPGTLVEVIIPNRTAALEDRAAFGLAQPAMLDGPKS